MHRPGWESELENCRHPGLAKKVAHAAGHLYTFAKAVVAAWAIFLVVNLESSGGCMAAPLYEDPVILRWLLTALAASDMVQIWAPAWLLLDIPTTKWRLTAGVLFLGVPAFLLGAMAVARGSEPRAGCADAATMGPFGTFEFCAIAVNLEGIAVVAMLVLGGLVGCTFSALSFGVAGCCLVPMVIIGHYRSRREENKRMSVLASLEPVLYSEEGMSSDSCAICLDDYETGSACIQLPCSTGHVFHEECLHSWLRRSRYCPMCRTDLIQVMSDARKAEGRACELVRPSAGDVETGDWN